MENTKQLPKSFFEKSRPHASSKDFAGKVIETKFSNEVLEGKRKVIVTVKKSK